MAVAVPLVAAGISALGSMQGGKGAEKAAKTAAAEQEKLANLQRQWALEDRQPWSQRLFPLLDSTGAAYAGGDYNIISPDLTSKSYDFFNKGLTEEETKQRQSLIQGLSRRGLDMSPERLSRTMADFGSRFADVRTGKGLELQGNAATTNWNARMGQLQSLLGALQGGYSQTQGQVGNANNVAYGGMADANATRLAGNQSYLSGLIGAANTMGQGLTDYYAYRQTYPKSINDAYPAYTPPNLQESDFITWPH